MADVEFHLPTLTHESTLIKPLDTSSSRASHDSAAASTRSWVLMDQNSPPPPAEPIPVPCTRAYTYTASFAPAPRAAAAHDRDRGRVAKRQEAHAHKGFVGGFVSGLRRLLRAGAHASVSTRDAAHRGRDGADGCDGQHAAAPRPPAEDVDMLEFPETPLENPYGREATSVHGTSLEATSPHHIRADDHFAVPPAELDNDEPVSVQAHPLPSANYRRIIGSPSFSAELNVNGLSRFLHALHLLPWVAAERITVDHESKQKPKRVVLSPERRIGRSACDPDRCFSASPPSPAPSRKHSYPHR
ncbi:hypothetical protein C8R45DRAFT_1180932 [Mycena sanguinolenta]|nr:hypothetical protein C8R45DRAFT_1180932 [Mycena sanguinolenta]